MIVTPLDWISFGLADSLKRLLRQLIWRCGISAQSKGLRSCLACDLQPDSSPDTRGIVSGSGRTEVRTTDTAVTSHKLSCGIFGAISCVRMVTGHSPAKGNSSALSVGLIERLWGWLLMWGLQHPGTLTCDGMATATVWLALHACVRVV